VGVANFSACQDVLRRVDRTFAALFRRSTSSEKARYPRFRSRSRYKLISVEDLNVKGLARSMLARSVHDAHWSQFLSILSSKAACAGRTVVRVNPAGTTAMFALPRAGPEDAEAAAARVRVVCLTLDRDHNAARNILYLAPGPGGAFRHQRWELSVSLPEKPPALAAGVIK
jgi:putative transposase